MSKFTVFFCCLLLAVSWPETSSKRLQKSWKTFEIAQSLYFGIDASKTIHDFLQNVESPLSEGETLIVSKLSQLSQDIKARRDAVLLTISNQLCTKLSENIRSIFKMAADVEFVYKRYLNISTTIKNQSVAELSDFAKINTLHELNLINGFERILFKMHEQLGVICSQKESSQQLILDLYDLVVDTHMKGLLVRKFAFSFRQEYEHANFKQNMDDDWGMFEEAVNKTYNAVKSAMEVAPRTLYRCNPSQWIQGENYEQLGPVLQTHVVVSSDITGDKGSCSTKKEKHTYFSDYSRRLEVEKRCEDGYIRDCEPLASSFEVCYSDKSSPRLYDWVKANNEVFGYKNTTSCSNMTMEESLGGLRSLFQNHCLCTCDSGRRAEDRYFSLRPILSDNLNNKVITGAQLIKIGPVFYIQIQQGEFGPNGTIIGEPEWKEIPSYYSASHWKIISELASTTTKTPIPFTEVYKDDVQKFVFDTKFHRNSFLYSVTYDTRKVLLDDLSAGENEVITGFQFTQVGDDLALSILVTPCDYETGKLHPQSAHWTTSKHHEARQEVVLTEPEVPITTDPKAELEISGQGHFVLFTTTDNHKDLGQNTVPFLDSQPVVTNPPMPLTGGGLILKRSGYSGGFLALQLKHYNLID